MIAIPEAIASGQGTGVTIGNFDGVHRGHRQLIGRTLDVCRAKGLLCVVVTFWPHPVMVLSGRQLAPIADRQARRRMLSGMGVDCLLELNFTREMAALAPEEFLSKYLYPLNMRELVIGYDFHLGKNRAGDFARLKEIGQHDGFGCERIEPVMLEAAPISSSRIRKTIDQGDMPMARAMLGRPHSFRGIVIHGEGRGTGLGYPTANLAVPETLLPPDGVYATRVRLGTTMWPAVTNIGFKPTFGGSERTIESFLLDCDANLYGREIRLDFLGRIRGERKFPDAQALTAQIAQDIQQARAFYEAIPDQPDVRA